jgi:hypothetical protein
VDIGGSVREFLRRLNIDGGGKSMAQFRKQMLALSLPKPRSSAAARPAGPQAQSKPEIPNLRCVPNR